MTSRAGIIPRDDRAWPRTSFPASVALGLGAVAAAVALAADAAGGGPRAVAGIAGAFLVTLALEAGLVVLILRRWVRGEPVPGWLTAAGLLVFLAAIVVPSAVADGRTMEAGLAGVFAGQFLPNAMAIRAARANRPFVDEAAAAMARAHAEVGALAAVRGGPLDLVPAARPVGLALRSAAVDERQRALAWTVAVALACGASLALEAPGPATQIMLWLGAGSLAWVLRRLWAARLAVRDFERAATPPRRTYVALVPDPYIPGARPLLGVWTQPPLVAGGRMPRADRVYRCSEHEVGLLLWPVHEAWVDTGPRPSSTPRWVAADTGIALPHRKALGGRWYLSSLLSGQWPGWPLELTMPSPDPVSEVMREEPRAGGNLPGMVLARLAMLAAPGLLLAWLASQN